jgi:hypothetical protein
MFIAAINATEAAPLTNHLRVRCRGNVTPETASGLDRPDAEVTMQRLPRTLTLERLDEVLDYDPKTGIFRWKIRMSSRAMAGQIAGTIGCWGYRIIQIDRQPFRAPHLAWWKYHRIFPTHEIDHKDHNRANDKIDNLRPAESIDQRHNSLKPTTNTSGFKGVTWEKRRHAWVAQIVIRGRHVHLGQFKELVDAAKAYDVAAVQNFGEFACINFPQGGQQ